MFIKILSKTDIIVIFIILFSAIFAFLITSKDKNKDVVISFNNQVFAMESLGNSKIIKLDSLAVIELKDKRARISFSSCRNQNCVNQGWSNALPIICVPNRIVLEFSGDGRRKKNEMFITR